MGHPDVEFTYLPGADIAALELSDAEIGQIAAGLRPGRESDEETILFWHRGLSLSDIAPGAAMLKRAQNRGIGRELPL